MGYVDEWKPPGPDKKEPRQVGTAAALKEYSTNDVAEEYTSAAELATFERCAAIVDAWGELDGWTQVFLAERLHWAAKANEFPLDPYPNPPTDWPAWDDPDWATKVYTDRAPLEVRKRLFVRLWNTFPDAARRAFLGKVVTPSELRRAMA